VQKADRKFAVGLMYIIEKFREVTEMKQDLSRGDFNVAELIGGCFDGIKVRYFLVYVAFVPTSCCLNWGIFCRCNLENNIS